MKITDPKILRELYDIESERKLLIGYRFKGCLAPARMPQGRHSAAKGHPNGLARKCFSPAN